MKGRGGRAWGDDVEGDWRGDEHRGKGESEGKRESEVEVGVSVRISV